MQPPVSPGAQSPLGPRAPDELDADAGLQADDLHRVAHLRSASDLLEQGPSRRCKREKTQRLVSEEQRP